MIQQAIHDVIEGQDLSFEAAKEVMNEIMSGETTPAQMAAFLTGLRMKGETIDEITACATVMREKGLKLEPNFAVIDIMGLLDSYDSGSLKIDGQEIKGLSDGKLATIRNQKIGLPS